MSACFPARQALRMRPARPCLLRNTFVRSDSTSTAPPLLLKLRSDLKTSMRAKETQKLNVIRGILADIADASKTQYPANTDIRILNFIQKRISQGKAAGQEFAKDGRTDLQEKEEGQVVILESYAGEVKTLGADEVRQHVGAALSELGQSGGKVNKGLLMKKLLGPGGALEGQPVEKQLVAQAVDTALASAL